MKGSLTTLVHVDMRTHAFLTITTNICLEGCGKEGAVAERELKCSFFFPSLEGRWGEKVGIDVLFLT